MMLSYIIVLVTLPPRYLNLVYLKAAGNSLRTYEVKRATLEYDTWQAYEYVYPSLSDVSITEPSVREQLSTDLTSCSWYEATGEEIDYETYDFGTVDNPALDDYPFNSLGNIDIEDIELGLESTETIIIYCNLNP